MTSQEGHSDGPDTQAAKRGEEEFEAALQHEKGEGVAQDFSEAARHLQQAARLNHTGAMVRLGKAYQCGRGVACNSNKAMRLLKKAASMGNKDAMAELAHFCSQEGCAEIDKRVLMKVCTQKKQKKATAKQCS